MSIEICYGGKVPILDTLQLAQKDHQVINKNWWSKAYPTYVGDSKLAYAALVRHYEPVELDTLSRRDWTGMPMELDTPSRRDWTLTKSIEGSMLILLLLMLRIGQSGSGTRAHHESLRERVTPNVTLFSFVY